MDNTLEGRLEQIVDIKGTLAQAITEQGVEISDEHTFAEYASKIAEIQGGGAGVVAPLGSAYNLFDTKLADHILTGNEAIGWELQGSQIHKSKYPTFYNTCLQEYNESEIIFTDFTIEDIDVSTISASSTSFKNPTNAFDGNEGTYASCGTSTDYIEWNIGYDIQLSGVRAWTAYQSNVARACNIAVFKVDENGLESLIGNGTGVDAQCSGISVVEFEPVIANRLRFKVIAAEGGLAPGSAYPSRIQKIEITAQKAIFKKHANGHLYYGVNNKALVDKLFKNNNCVWAYGIDTKANRIYLPSTQYITKPIIDVNDVNNITQASLPNIKGAIPISYNVLLQEKDPTGAFDLNFVQSEQLQGIGADTVISQGNTSVVFDASKASPVYNSQDNVVQPTAVNKLLYICVGNTGITHFADSSNTADLLKLFETKHVDHKLYGNAAIGWELQGSTLARKMYPDFYNVCEQEYTYAKNKTLESLNDINVFGNVHIEGCIASNFTLDNYIMTPNNFMPAAGTPWEVVINFTTESNADIYSDITCLYGYNGFIVRRNLDNTISLYIDGGKNNWAVANGITSSQTLKPYNEYTVKLCFTGTQYIVQIKDEFVEDSQFEDYITVNSTQSITGGPMYIGVRHNSGGYVNYTTASVDLSKCYTKIGDEITWTGCIKPDYYVHDNGHIYYDSTQPVQSNAYGIDINNKTITLPTKQTEDFVYYCVGRTASAVNNCVINSNMFDIKQVDYKLNNECWAEQGSIVDCLQYPDFYKACIDEYKQCEAMEHEDVTIYVHDNGHVYYDIKNKHVAQDNWYGIDFTNKTIQLPTMNNNTYICIKDNQSMYLNRFDLFDVKQSDKIIENEAWGSSRQIVYKSQHPDFYNACVQEYMEAQDAQESYSSNVIKVGNVIEKDLTFTNFTSTSFLETSYTIPTTINNFELVCKVKLPHSVSTLGTVYGQMDKNYYCPQINVTTTGALTLYLSTGTSSWNLFSATPITPTGFFDRVIWGKVTWDGKTYTLSYSQDGKNWIIMTQKSSSITPTWKECFRMGVDQSSVGNIGPKDMIIYAKDCYLKINEREIWRGASAFDIKQHKSGHKYYNCNDSKSIIAVDKLCQDRDEVYLYGVDLEQECITLPKLKQEENKYTYMCIGSYTTGKAAIDLSKEIELNNPFFLGMSQYMENDPNNISWLHSDGQFHTKAMYPSMYSWILDNYNNVTPDFKSIQDEYDDYCYVIDENTQTFRLPLLNGKENLPGETYIHTQLPAAESNIVAPVNGWYNYSIKATSAGQYAIICNKTPNKNNENINDVCYAAVADSHLACSVFAKRGDNLLYTYTAKGAVNRCGYVPCVGNGKLYYYVGEAVNNANIIDVSKLRSEIATKLTKDSLELDGPWVMQDLDLASGASMATTAQVTYSLESYLPQDTYEYEVILHAYGSTAAKSGASVHLSAYTDVCTSARLVAYEMCRSSSATYWGNEINIVVGSTRSIKIVNAGNNTATITKLAVRGYRRVRR